MALDPDRFRKWTKVATIGPILAIAIFGGTFVGSWADGKLGSKPWGMLVGLLLGTVGGFLEMLRQVRETREPEKGSKDRKRGPDEP